MHVALYTQGHVVDYWVFKPSFPSFLLPYHLKPTLHLCSKATMRPWDLTFFDIMYLDRYMIVG